MKLPITHYLLPITALAFLLFDISICHAKAEIHPRLSVREEYNDNVFLDPPDAEEGDFITTVEPGVAALWETRRWTLDLDYALRYRKYAEFSEKDETSLRDTQRGTARLALFPEKDFTVVVTDVYSRVTVDPRDPVVEGNDFVNRANLNALSVNPRYRLARKTWSATLGYAYENLAYDTPEGDDSEAHRGSLEVVKSLSARLDLFATATGEDRRIQDQTDYRRADAFAGATWKPGARLSLTASGGATQIDYADEAGRLPGESDSRNWTWQGRGVWQVRPEITASAGYGEAVALSVNEGLYESRTADASLAYTGKLTAELSARASEADYLATDRRDRAAGIALALGIPFGKVLALALRADVERVAYQPGDEDAWRCHGTAGLTWTGRIMSATVGYNVEAENSDVDANDYINNIVYLQGGVKF